MSTKRIFFVVIVASIVNVVIALIIWHYKIGIPWREGKVVVALGVSVVIGSLLFDRLTRARKRDSRAK